MLPLRRQNKRAVDHADHVEFGQRAIDAIVQKDMRAIAHGLDRGGHGKGIGHKTTSGFADQGGPVSTEGFGRNAVDQGEDRLQLRGLTVQPVRREAAAHIQAGDFHACAARDVARRADVMLPRRRVRALCAGVEGQRRDKARLGHRLEQVDGKLHRCAELGTEVIGGPRHRQFEPHGNFGALCRNQFDQLRKFRPRINRIGLHTQRYRHADFRPRADRVVVMQRRFRGEAADHPHLEGRSHVIAAHAGGGEVFDHGLFRVRLDGIGHQAGKAIKEPARGCLQGRRGKEQHRRFGPVRAKKFGRSRPYRFRESHRLSFSVPTRRKLFSCPGLDGSGDALRVHSNQARCV